MREWKELCRFEIPMLPPSVNTIYGIKSGRRGSRMFLSSEARRFKEQAKLFMPPRSISRSSLLALEIEVFSNWYFKNGKIRKLDLQNLEKILIDAISERYDLLDETVFEKVSRKTESETDKIMVILRTEIVIASTKLLPSTS